MDNLIWLRIYLTTMIVISLVFSGSWFLFNLDEKREDTWFKVSIISGIVLVCMVLGIALFTIWS